MVFIRKAHVEDRGILGELKLRASMAWGDHLEQLQALPEAREVPVEHLPHAFVAEFDGKIVGFVTVLFNDGSLQAELEDLFVAPEVWRRGIGKTLLTKAELRVAELGARTIRVAAGEQARPFYEAAGYRFVASVATEFAPAVELHKILRR